MILLLVLTSSLGLKIIFLVGKFKLLLEASFGEPIEEQGNHNSPVYKKG
jgi:hypothetical protein